MPKPSVVLQAAKDYVIRRGVEQFLEEYVTRMVKLSIDPEGKSIQCSVELKGEDTPIDVDVKRYELDERDGTVRVVIHEISVSKEWMHVLANEVVKGRPFEMGAGSAKIVKLLNMMKLV